MERESFAMTNFSFFGQQVLETGTLTFDLSRKMVKILIKFCYTYFPDSAQNLVPAIFQIGHFHNWRQMNFVEPLKIEFLQLFINSARIRIKEIEG